MNINPITALSEQLQKLINEHGSASILRDHLALFKDQLIVFEKKTPILENTIKTLESQLQNATKEIGRQKQVIEALQGSQSTKKYNEITEKILKLFFDTGREIPMNQFLSIVSENMSVLQYHFDLLIKDNLIWRSTEGQQSSWARVNEPDLYSLTPQGREYVVKNSIN